MPKPIRKSSRSTHEYYEGQHRFEHWYVDNQVYFITARCRARFPAFESEAAKAVFWDRFDHYTREAGFTPWVTTLIPNHYHTLGYCREGLKLKAMMQRIHGSVSKLVNDILMRTLPGTPDGARLSGLAGLDAPRPVPLRLLPFWRDAKGKEYFDGCIRDARQGTRAYRYTYTQCRRHGICSDPRLYPHTRVNVELEPALKRALELGAFMEGVPYPRYMRPKRDQGRDAGRDPEGGRGPA